MSTHTYTQQAQARWAQKPNASKRARTKGKSPGDCLAGFFLRPRKGEIKDKEYSVTEKSVTAANRQREKMSIGKLKPKKWI